MYALGPLDVGYNLWQQPGSRAGLQRHGSVYLQNAVNVQLPHNAKQIAEATKPIDTGKMRAGDMVFFNTMNRLYSAYGHLYRRRQFIHAPRTNSVICVDTLAFGLFLG